MGQGRSKDRVYVSPELSSQPMRKSGSLNSVNSTRMGRKNSLSTLKRSRSLKENKEAQEQQLREKIEKEAKDLDRWVNDRPKKYREFITPSLIDLACVAISKNLSSPFDVEGLPISTELKAAIEFRLSPTFDQSMADPKITFTNGARSAVYLGKGYSTIVMKTPFGRGFCHGRHAWIIHIDSSRVQGWIQIGVVNEVRYKAKCKTVWDGNPHPFRVGEMARRNNGNFHSGRSQLEATMVHETIFLGGYGLKDTIAMQVDFDTRQLQWLKNGEVYGDKIPFESGPIYPCASLDSPGEGLTLAYYTGPIAL